MTLVATGADYSGLISQDEVPWFDGSHLVDPVDWLSARERKALSEWIRSISKELSKHVTHSVRKDRMVELVNAFAGDLDSTAKAPNDSEKILSEKLRMGFSGGIFDLLDRPLMREISSVSDVAVVTTKPNAPLYYLIDPLLAQQWQQSPKEIVIYGDVNLATSNRYTSTGFFEGELTPGQSESNGKEPRRLWCTPDFFFQNRLIYLRDGGAAFPGCLPLSVTGETKKRSVVLPLSAEVLRLFTPKELQDSFSMAWLPNGGATCYLRLRLRTSDGKDRLCRIQRTYSESEMVLVEECRWSAFGPISEWRRSNGKVTIPSKCGPRESSMSWPCGHGRTTNANPLTAGLIISMGGILRSASRKTTLKC